MVVSQLSSACAAEVMVGSYACAVCAHGPLHKHECVVVNASTPPQTKRQITGLAQRAVQLEQATSTHNTSVISRKGDMQVSNAQADLEPACCQVSMSVFLCQPLADCQDCGHHTTTVQLPLAALGAVLQVLGEHIHMLQTHAQTHGGKLASAR